MPATKFKKERNYIVKVDRNGNESWTLRGQYHRDDDLPARTYTNGTKLWYQRGEFHRDGDKPAKEYDDGKKMWYQNGQLHRDEGPAIITPIGRKEWYQNGQLHRDDGPAMITETGRQKYYYKGKNVGMLDVELQRIPPMRLLQVEVELTVAEIESILGHKIKIVSES